MVSCNLNQYSQFSFESDKFYFTFNNNIPSSLKTKINSINNLSSDNANSKIQVNIKDYNINRYDIYSGSALKALETEIKGILIFEIFTKNSIITKNINVVKRSNAIELNPLAENEMFKYIEEEIMNDLIRQLTLEVTLIDL
tara:strand:+ start:1776 stop:2198 length:423 start_codon:yes stop_codon:yes gene_type:complete